MGIPAWLGAGGLALAGSLVNSALNVRESRKNREFQERMSSTAHQREVRDLKLAGINPSLRQMSGASTPAGDRAEIDVGMDRAVSTGMQAKLMQAQLKLMEAQRQKTEDEALLTRTHVGDIQMQWKAGRFDRLVSERELSELSVQERRQMVPLVVQRAREEIQSIMSSAQAARARAALDKAALQGALNLEAFEKSMGTATPAVKFLHLLLRSLR